MLSLSSNCFLISPSIRFLSLLIYNMAIGLLSFLMKAGSLFNPKAKAIIDGRKGWKKKLLEITSEKKSWIWIHCASLGEFEQGRPVIESLKKTYPQHKVLLTFFSSSGYNVRKDYEHADAVMYMPADTRSNAEFFIKQLCPVLAVFVKYEFWYHHLDQLRRNNVKCILISATFRKDQPFFKWYGEFFRKMLRGFNAIFTQDQISVDLLKNIGVSENVFFAGDTRYDRVVEVLENKKEIPAVTEFLSGANLFIAGSTWEKDEQVLYRSMDIIPNNWKIIIAPHEINEHRLDFIRRLFNNNILFFSQIKNGETIDDKKILVIDNIGMLSSLYSYGDVAYVGGGFQKGGIHNVLEPAVFGLPVIFGPHYKKFVEAVDLKEKRFAYLIEGADDLKEILPKLIKMEKEPLQNYIKSKTGATDSIVHFIRQNGWL